MPKNARAQSILLHEEDAIAIYLAKIQNKPRDLAAKLANRYRISTKVVRDIWSLRTWVRATRPSWTQADQQFYVKNRLCAKCIRNNVNSLDAACQSCLSRIDSPEGQQQSPSHCPGATEESEGGSAGLESGSESRDKALSVFGSPSHCPGATEESEGGSAGLESGSESRDKALHSVFGSNSYLRYSHDRGLWAKGDERLGGILEEALCHLHQT
jgi:hypothetical protein